MTFYHATDGGAIAKIKTLGLLRGYVTQSLSHAQHYAGLIQAAGEDAWIVEISIPSDAYSCDVREVCADGTKIVRAWKHHRD